MAAIGLDYATLDDALRNLGQSETALPGWKNQQRRIFNSVFQTDISQPTPSATPLAGFPDPGQPFGVVPAPSLGVPTQTQSSDDLILPDANETTPRYQELQVPPAAGAASAGPAEEQIRFDRAWHVVTARIALPSSVAAEDSFGSLAPESQIPSQDVSSEQIFQEARHLVLNARTLLPHAHHTDDILAWHTHQVRRHYAQHVLPMLSACADAPLPRNANSAKRDSRFYDHHMMVVGNSVRTLEAAFRQYLYGLMLIARGLPSDDDSDDSENKENSDKSAKAAGSGSGQGQPLPKASTVVSRFRQDVYALVANSASPSLMLSIRLVFTRIASILLGFDDAASKTSATLSPSQAKPRPSQPSSLPNPPSEDDAQAQALRQKMHELLESMHNVGLAGEKFQIVFAEIMDEKMVDFIQLSFAGRWAENTAAASSTTADDSLSITGSSSLSARPKSRLSKAQAAATNIASLYDWMENHFARLSHEVMAHISNQQDAVSFADVKKWKEVGLERLSMLRMTELFDIVLNWPLSRGGLEDLRVSVTTPQRRSQLVAAFTAAMRKRLLNPACSTLQILQTYIAMIHTFHALDPSNVLLSAAVGPMQLYLCQREDAVRIVVDGLLADPEEDDAGKSSSSSPPPPAVPVTPSKPQHASSKKEGPTVAERLAKSVASVSEGKLVELAAILNDPQQQRRRHIDEEELDWNDMDWVPDPIDAGTNYRRPKSEDVIGTLINALGSREAFTKEFQNILAERLLSSSASSQSGTAFSKETKVLELLKKRFGEASLQSCEVMMRDIQDSASLDGAIRAALDEKKRQRQQEEDEQAELPSWARPDSDPLSARQRRREFDTKYRAKILSRLYWPGILENNRETFLLPGPVAAVQKRYEAGYEERKASRKLAWLNQLGEAAVELELADRTVTVECKTYEAAVIYAFDGPEACESSESSARRSAAELVEMLQMDADLVDMAVEYWQKQGVLRLEGDKYIVVESLSSGSGETAEAGGDAMEVEPGPSTPAQRPSRRQGRADEAQRTVYWQFIVGMLTNSAASMPLAQIGMMMKMLIAEGFPWSNEELQEFLGDKVADGELEVMGGKYRLVKK